MYPTEGRIRELQERFSVHNGQFWGHYRFKNLNWYLGKDHGPTDNEEWFCYGDVRDEDVSRLQELLVDNEILTLGWKDLGANQKYHDMFGDGGGIWLVITKEGVQYDKREANRRGG